MPKWATAEITEKRVWSEGLFTIRVATTDVEPFLPGQFLQLGLVVPSADGEERLINRPYSVASPHGEVLDFFIVMVDGGELTPHLWALDAGDRLQVSQKATGSFTLAKTPAASNIWLVATGTGLAPYIAMLRDGEIWGNYESVILVHGVRHATDLAYTEELKSLEMAKPGRFKLIQTMTRDRQEGVLTGRIPVLFESGELEQVAQQECHHRSSVLMLCGNPAMLDSMEESLAQREMKRHRHKAPGQIVLERYW